MCVHLYLSENRVDDDDNDNTDDSIYLHLNNICFCFEIHRIKIPSCQILGGLV